MNCRALLAAVALAALHGSAPGASPRERTDTGQFTIYCDDASLRRQVASFAVRTKSELLALFDESDNWRHPIIVTIQLAGPAPSEKPMTFNVVETVVGMKVEIVARVGHQPADVNLQKQVIKAVLLESMYRRNPIKAGSSFREPPWWIVEGAVELMRRHDGGPDARFFRTLIDTNKLPPIELFLAEKPDELGPTAFAVDRALAMALVQLLLEQPDGRHRLTNLLREWPNGNGDPIAALGREFPGLAGGAPALQRWWTLNLARYAASDRAEGLTMEETDRQIGTLLEFDVPVKEGPPRRFTVEKFSDYLKLPASKDALAGQRAAVVALSIRANVLLKPVLATYDECFSMLSHGKTRGLRERLERAARLRESVSHRAEEIGDYLNWFEATQMGARSNVFQNFLKTADELSNQEKRRNDPIARYLDELEREF